MTQLIRVSHWALFWFLLIEPFHIYALPSNDAQQTSVQQISDYPNMNPAPTAPPTLLQRDLLPRQNEGPVCGFANADINSAMVCPVGYQCAINPYDYAADCCVDPYNCEYHTACVPYISMADCGAACQSDVFVTKCTDEAQPYCYIKLFELSGYSDPFYEVDCNSIPGTLTVYQSYTNDAAQTISPELLVITTTASIPYTTTAQGAQATGGTIVQCGNGGSSGGSGSGGGDVTCNVGAGNNGNGGGGSGSKGSAPRLDRHLMIRTLIWWVLMELFRWALS